MSAVLVVLLVLVAAVVAGVGALVASHNRFVRLRNTVEESWRQVDVELQRRHDVIGSLVEVTSAAARFERDLLQQVTQARGTAVAAHGAGPARQGQAEDRLTGAVAGFLRAAETHPDLRSNTDFRYLQEQLVECEDRIAAGRRFYNGNVRAYNTGFDTFPSSLVASRGGFSKKEYYEVDDPHVRAAPSLRDFGGPAPGRLPPPPARPAAPDPFSPD